MADTIEQQREWSARHRFCRIAPRKARLIATLIRGQNCQTALSTLRFSPQRAATFMTTLLKSAMANANEQEADMNRLVVSEARVDGGPIIKRWRPKDRGRAHPIAKRTSHLIIKLAER